MKAYRTLQTAQSAQQRTLDPIVGVLSKQTEINAVVDFAKSKDISLRLFEDASESAPEGYFANGVLNVNIYSSEGMFYTAVHEYMHYLEEFAPRLLTDYLNQVDKLIEMSADFKKIADDVRATYKGNSETANISEPDLRKEIAFKITKSLINDTNQFQDSYP